MQLLHKEGVLYLNTVELGFSSATLAIKAKRLLRKSGVQSKLVKSDGDLASLGCVHALLIIKEEFFVAVSILKRASIEYRTIGV